MLDATKMTIEELRALLQEREEREREESRPKPLANPDFSAVIKLCQALIDELAEADSCCDMSDNDHYIYEAAMQAVFGKDVWLWINERMGWPGPITDKEYERTCQHCDRDACRKRWGEP